MSRRSPFVMTLATGALLGAQVACIGTSNPPMKGDTEDSASNASNASNAEGAAAAPEATPAPQAPPTTKTPGAENKETTP